MIPPPNGGLPKGDRAVNDSQSKTGPSGGGVTRRGVAARAPHAAPTPVRDIVVDTMQRLSARHHESSVVDFPTWKRLVGARTARHAQPTMLRQGRLVVRAEDSALLYELSLRAPELLAGLRHELPERDIRELSFHVGEVAW